MEQEFGVLDKYLKVTRYQYQYQVFPGNRFPFAEFLVAFGLLLILSIEQIAIDCNDKSSDCRNPIERLQSRNSQLERETLTANAQVELNTPPSPPFPEPNPPVNSQSKFNSLILLLALSVHSLFEGLTIGLLKSPSVVLQLFIAILVHKIPVAFSLGSSLVQSELKTSAVIHFDLWFSLMTPIGTGIGVLLNTLPSVIDLQLLNGILIPKTAIYIPNFISSLEENELIQKVYSAPKPKWTQLKNRRLQNWGGIPHPKGMIPEKMPEWLQKYINRINSYCIFEEQCSPNHVLINEYQPGQGIMPHVDGPLFHPIITTINCGSHTVLRLRTTDNSETLQENFSLLLEPKSLLILRDELYTDYLHSIEDITEDIVDSSIRNLHLCQEKHITGQRLKRSVRLSFTIRHVPRCSNFKLRF
ncbi:hypothetical protein V9T40_006753 [Parthenolecanium corni]|uniref:Fe2OG dioxygenase domain-containing protein n=1 Tax=Parthenolecanium corni TaxID=536013 RepID=A0AAN9Y911_9HEMI